MADGQVVAGAQVAQAQVGAVVVLDLVDAALHQLPAGGEEGLVLGEEVLARGQEVGPHPRREAGDVEDGLGLEGVEEPQPAAAGDVGGATQVEVQVAVPPVAHVAARLGVEPAGPLGERKLVAAEVAGLVLATGAAGARIVAASERPGSGVDEGLELVEEVLVGVLTGPSEQLHGGAGVAPVGLEGGEGAAGEGVVGGVADGVLEDGLGGVGVAGVVEGPAGQPAAAAPELPVGVVEASRAPSGFGPSQLTSTGCRLRG